MSAEKKEASIARRASMKRAGSSLILEEAAPQNAAHHDHHDGHMSPVRNGTFFSKENLGVIFSDSPPKQQSYENWSSNFGPANAEPSRPTTRLFFSRYATHRTTCNPHNAYRSHFRMAEIKSIEELREVMPRRSV